MFKAEMVAPCGLDCNICSQALLEKDPCQGCNGPADHKPEFCAMYCGIFLCRKRRENGYKYCDECPDYPCEDVMEKENRYTSQYPHRKSPLENLQMIREKGWTHFLNISGSIGPVRTAAGLFRSMTGIVRIAGKELYDAYGTIRSRMNVRFRNSCENRCI